VSSFPIPLRLLRAAQPRLLTPVLQGVHRIINRLLLEQAGLKSGQADGEASPMTALRPSNLRALRLEWVDCGRFTEPAYGSIVVFETTSPKIL